MKLPKYIYVCSYSKVLDEPKKEKCYWYHKKNKKCTIDNKPCNQVTYIQKDKSCTPLKNVKASAR